MHGDDKSEPFDLGAMLAVEMWMDRPAKGFPADWADELVNRGVGIRKEDGSVTLNARGWKLRDRLMGHRH